MSLSLPLTLRVRRWFAQVFSSNLYYEIMHFTQGGKYRGRFRAQSPAMSCPAIGKDGVLFVGADFRMYALR